MEDAIMLKKIFSILAYFFSIFVVAVGFGIFFGYSARESSKIGAAAIIFLLPIMCVVKWKNYDEFFRKCWVVLKLNIGVMAIITLVAIVRAAFLMNSSMDLKELIEAGFFLWAILSIFGGGIVSIAVVIREVYIFAFGFCLVCRSLWNNSFRVS
jgi:hypothetical protein